MPEPRTRFDTILHGLRDLVAGDPFFPEPREDQPETSNMRGPIPGAASALKDHCVVDADEEPLEVTRDGGAENSWELEGRYFVTYAVFGGALKERRARRDAAAVHLAALIRGSRDLGLQDPQIYAELAAPDRADDVVVKGAPGFAIIRIPVNVQFIADSAAG